MTFKNITPLNPKDLNFIDDLGWEFTDLSDAFDAFCFLNQHQIEAKFL